MSFNVKGDEINKTFIVQIGPIKNGNVKFSMA